MEVENGPFGRLYGALSFYKQRVLHFVMCSSKRTRDAHFAWPPNLAIPASRDLPRPMTLAAQSGATEALGLVHQEVPPKGATTALARGRY